MGIKVDGKNIPFGSPGVGVPKGGTVQQALIKKSDNDYDTEWSSTVPVAETALDASHSDTADKVTNSLTVGEGSVNKFTYDGSQPKHLTLQSLSTRESQIGLTDVNDVVTSSIIGITQGKSLAHMPYSENTAYNNINAGMLFNLGAPDTGSNDQMQFLCGNTPDNALYFRTGYPTYTPRPEWRPWCQIITDLNAGINKNLLVNYNFKNPVNQRGQTSYSSHAYCIDDWFFRLDNSSTVSSSGTVTLTSDGLHIQTNATSGSTGFNQRIEFPSELFGKTVTISCYITANNGPGNMRMGTALGNGVWANSSWVSGPYLDIPAGATGLFQKTGVMLNNTGDYSGQNFGFYLGNSSKVDVTIAAVKLELGPRQTLCRKNSSGQWEITDVPSYSEQLTKCMRYLQVFGNRPGYEDIGFLMSVANGKGCVIQIPLLVPMRTQPTQTIAGNIRLINHTSYTYLITQSDFATGSYFEGEYNVASFGTNALPSTTKLPTTLTTYWGNVDNAGNSANRVILSAEL